MYDSTETGEPVCDRCEGPCRDVEHDEQVPTMQQSYPINWTEALRGFAE